MSRVRTRLIGLILAICIIDALSAAGVKWTAVLHKDDFIIGPELQNLNTRHHWKWKLEEGPEIAVRKSAVPIPAPKCQMDYLILAIPALYPEPGKPQASAQERQAIYDAFMSIKKKGTGSIKITFDAMFYWEDKPSGAELTSCNIWFTLPLEKDASKILP